MAFTEASSCFRCGFTEISLEQPDSHPENFPFFENTVNPFVS